ncbi:MAG: enoyl-CoA hydratase/isomerase family protein [Thermodesulfobacteriota bacterium]|jgi:enoyl-CoA hydratase
MGDKSYECILYEKKDGIATITFNRPKALNAINIEMAEELKDALSDFKDDEETKVGILTGAGEKAFCSGGDISMFSEKLTNTTAVYEWLRTGEDIHRLLMERIEKPIIAAVNGYCFAGGLEMALACDFIIASDNAKFGLAEITIGVLPGWGGMTRLPRAIPVRKAKEMIYTGEPISAQEAEKIGLVNRVVPKSQLYDVVIEIAKKLAAKSSLALRIAKKTLNHGLEVSSMDAALFLERGATCIVSAGEDSQEGIRAFLEKRPPKFK